MIRPFTCLCLLVAAGSGLYLYSVKHDAQMLDREITKLGHQAQESRSRAAMMRAEYDRLGDPDRLRELATMVLPLQPTDPAQFASMADLERRLAAVNAGVQANPAPYEPPQMLATAVEPVRAASPMAAPTAAPQEKPVFAEKAPPVEKAIVERPAPPIQLAVARQVPAPKPATPPPQPVALPVHAPPPAPPPSLLAFAQPTPRPALVRTAAAAEARPAPRPTPLFEMPTRPTRATATQDPPVRAQPSAPSPAPAAAPVFASSLGMARIQTPLPANVLTPTSYTPPRR